MSIGDLYAQLGYEAHPVYLAMRESEAGPFLLFQLDRDGRPRRIPGAPDFATAHDAWHYVSAKYRKADISRFYVSDTQNTKI
jgi:hypothetical protein